MRLMKKILLLSLAGATLAGSAKAANGISLEGYDTITNAPADSGLAHTHVPVTLMNAPITLGVISSVKEGLDLFLGFLEADDDQGEAIAAHAGGIGYRFDKSSKLDLGLSFAPEAEIVQASGNNTLTDRQLGWRLLYIRHFD